MADIGLALRHKLVGTTAVAAILGTRIYPDKLPQGATLPAAVYYGISGNDEPGLAGLLGRAEQRVQIDAIASGKSLDGRADANALSKAIRDALTSSWGRGAWGSTGATVVVSGCVPEGGERYDTQGLGDGSDDDQYITSRDYIIYFAG
jgi:hypothetical protein